MTTENSNVANTVTETTVTETVEPKAAPKSQELRFGESQVAKVGKIDEQIAGFQTKIAELRSERSKKVKFIREIERLEGVQLLSTPARNSGGKPGRKRSESSLGGMILRVLDGGPKNAAGLESGVVDLGYEFNGKTKPYHRIHSELQRLKKAQLIVGNVEDSSLERGSYRLVPQPEATPEATPESTESDTSDEAGESFSTEG